MGHSLGRLGDGAPGQQELGGMLSPAGSCHRVMKGRGAGGAAEGGGWMLLPSPSPRKPQTQASDVFWPEGNLQRPQLKWLLVEDLRGS